MLKRTFTGAGITVAVYLILYFSYIPGVLSCAVALLTAFSVYEIYGAAGMSRHPVGLPCAMIAMMAVVLVPFPHYGRVLLLVFPAAVAAFLWMMYKQDSFRLDRPGKVSLVALAVAFLFKAMPELRQIDGGLIYLTASVTLCFVTDVAAYLVGSRFGRHKLVPKVSPNKTVEGAAAGVAASVLGMLVLGVFLSSWEGYPVSYPLLAVYGLLASVVAQFGDLSMSVVKRVCGIKDFGKLLPGHGGILDRFDSHLFCVAFTLLFCTLTGGFLK